MWIHYYSFLYMNITENKWMHITFFCSTLIVTVETFELKAVTELICSSMEHHKFFEIFKRWYYILCWLNKSPINFDLKVFKLSGNFLFGHLNYDELANVRKLFQSLFGLENIEIILTNPTMLYERKKKTSLVRLNFHSDVK